MDRRASLDERLRRALTPTMLARAEATTPDAVAQWPAVRRTQAEQALLARVRGFLRTHSRLMLDLGARYHLPPDLELGRAVEAGWLPASAASALFALWCSPEGQLVQEVLDQAHAVGTIAACLVLVARARQATDAATAAPAPPPPDPDR